MTLEAQKLNLVSRILSINNESVLELVDKAVQQIERMAAKKLEDISFYIGHIEPKVDIEALKGEQQIQPLLLSELDLLIEEAHFTEDIDDLLHLLN